MLPHVCDARSRQRWLSFVSLGRKYKMNNSVTITIRNVETSDISIFFEQQLDLEANRMAAFVRDDPHNRAAFGDMHVPYTLATPTRPFSLIPRCAYPESHTPMRTG